LAACSHWYKESKEKRGEGKGRILRRKERRKMRCSKKIWQVAFARCHTEEVIHLG
jgi:hypothetical protein